MGSDELDFSRKAHVKVGHLKNIDFIKYSILRFLIWPVQCDEWHFHWRPVKISSYLLLIEQNIITNVNLFARSFLRNYF